MKAAKRFRSIALDLFLILIAAACLLPFWWTIVMSTLPANLTINDPPMIPGNQFLVNLEELLSKVDVFRSFAKKLRLLAQPTNPRCNDMQRKYR